MAERVTIQDIADALGLSRNTVSKAINNTGVLADSTREKILLKAVEMGYKQFSYINPDDLRVSLSSELGMGADTKKSGIIALLTTCQLNNSHFASTMLDKIHRELSQAGYSLTMYRITPEDLAARRLPSSFSPEKIDAVMCIEVFDLEYSLFLTSHSFPVLFIDCPVVTGGKKLAADVLLMNNRSEIYTFVKKMKMRGKKTFGYVGHTMHCLSFMERFLAMGESLHFNELPYHPEFCITGIYPDIEISSGKPYQDYLAEQLEKMPGIPDVFICANDFVAYDLLQVCKQKGLEIPRDFYLCGFDDSAESRVITPSLTTVHIHSQIMGFSATQLLLTRINNPYLNYRTVYTETSLICRESTEF